MRLVIVEDVSAADIAEILNTRHECACVKEEEEEEYPFADVCYLMGKTIQIDDPSGGYIKGKVVKASNPRGCVTLDNGVEYNAKYISGIIS